jgi:hypothetical protein
VKLLYDGLTPEKRKKGEKIKKEIHENNNNDDNNNNNNNNNNKINHPFTKGQKQT